MKYRKDNKFKMYDNVLIINDPKDVLFQIYSVHESGYSLIHARTGVVLPNIVNENKLIFALNREIK